MFNADKRAANNKVIAKNTWNKKSKVVLLLLTLQHAAPTPLPITNNQIIGLTIALINRAFWWNSLFIFTANNCFNWTPTHHLSLCCGLQNVHK